VAFVVFAGRARPADPVARADFETSVADLRAAVCIEAGVAPEDISPLGYDNSDAAYARVRAGWVRHIEQFGVAMFDRGVEWAHGLWLDARPDLAVGDDWHAEGEKLHRARYPLGCWHGRENVACYPAPAGSCVICCPVPEED
jgi:hypothetical protein